MHADRNLLFAVLALQADCLTRDQFIEGCALWAARKEVPLADLLVGKGWLTAGERAAVDVILERKLKRHAGDVTATFAAAADPGIRATLAAADPAVAATVSGLGGVASSVHLAALSEPPTGTGRYDTTRIHAEGGVGRVWVARDPALGREVALKELRPDQAGNPAARDRFVREARVTGQLEHPGVVPVYELGTRAEGGLPFYTMRFVHGRTLAEAVRHDRDRREAGTAGPLDRRDRLGEVVAVCQAVAYAHSRGVLHRDLKPQNVVLGDFGEVMVLDWGLAKLLGPDEDDPAGTTELTPPLAGGSETVQGSVLGSPAYMAPEQAAGDLAAIGPATDVFGLGAILYEVLTGRAPFAGRSTEEVLRLAREGSPPTPRAVDASIPRALDAICRKAMAKLPAERYPSASALADDLRHHLADEPVSAYREGLATRTRRWAKRHRTPVAVATVLFLVIAVGGTAFAAWRERKREEALARIYERQNLAHGAAQAGDVDKAITLFGEYEVLAQALGEEHFSRYAADRRRELERFREFRTKAAAALREGVHNVRSVQKPDPVLAKCEEALAVYHGPDNANPQSHFDVGILTAREVDEVLFNVHELYVMAAIRLAMFDTKDDAGKANTRKALGYLDRAAAMTLYFPQGYKRTGPTAGELMLRMLWHRRLGENEQADDAGEKMTALVKADGGLQTARDHYLFGSVSLNVLKKPKEALEAYRQALKREPNHYGALFGTYLSCNEMKDSAGKLAALTALIAVRPGEKELFYFRGMTYFEAQNYDAAFHDFDAAVLRDDRYATGYFYRGRMLVVKNRWPDAEADFSRAVTLDPKLVPARYWLGVARAKVGRHAEAVSDAEAAVAAEPTNRQTLYFAARAYSVAVQAAKADAALAKKYGDRCVELLRRAFEHGFTDRDRLAPGGDFDPVRERADFQSLVTPGKAK